MWFFPTLILLTPLLSRACVVEMSSKPRPAAPSNEQICIEQYEECVVLCEAGETETDTGETDTGDETDTETGDETETDTGEDSECVQACEQELENCFEFGAPTPPTSPYPQETERPSCDPQEGYCGYDDNDNYDYGEPVGGEPVHGSDDDYEWGCDLSGFCTSSDDYSTDDYSDDEGGGWDCSADNSDEGESDSDGDGDWGEDWGERSPGGGDGIDAPSDLPAG